MATNKKMFKMTPEELQNWIQVNRKAGFIPNKKKNQKQKHKGKEVD